MRGVRLIGQINEIWYCGKLARACSNWGKLVVEKGFAMTNFMVCVILHQEMASSSQIMMEYGNNGRPQKARQVLEEFPLRDTFSSNAMMLAYAKSGHLQKARSLFSQMSRHNVASWNVMIAGHAWNGQGKEALNYFEKMDMEPNKFTFISVLEACAVLADVETARMIHSWIGYCGFESDVALATSLIHVYGKCQSPEEARWVFDNAPHLNVVSWNAMIEVYAKNKQSEDSIKLFRQMPTEGIEPNKVTFINILVACSGSTALKEGRLIHAGIVRYGFELDLVVATSLVNMYGKCGHVSDAKKVFDRIDQRDLVLWSAMIAAYAQNEAGKEALELLKQMDKKLMKPDAITLVSIIDACASMVDLKQGKIVHARIVHQGFESNVVVGTSLVNMYGKCKRLESARRVFNSIPRCNVVSWNAMIAAYAQNGEGQRALDMFQKMVLEDVKPSEITFTSLLDACTSLATLEKGKTVHASIACVGFKEVDVAMATALVSMYGKCGSLKNARRVFDKMGQRNLITWNTLTAVYALNGKGREAITLFRQMGIEGIKPNGSTFLSILSGCSHAGLLNDGLSHFASMYRDHGIIPTVEHFVSVINLLGRSGRLDESEGVLSNLPFESPFELNAIACSSLLAACRLYTDVERGKHVADLLLELNPKLNDAPYVLLSYGMILPRRKMMDDVSIREKPGPIQEWLAYNVSTQRRVVEDMQVDRLQRHDVF